MKLPDRLREARKEAGLTQAELAELAGLRPATISSIERGRAYHSHTIEKIEGVFAERGIVL